MLVSKSPALGSSFGFITGPSAVGKGYGIASILCEYFATETFVTGDWSRQFRADEANSGRLVNDELIVSAADAHYKQVCRQRQGAPFNYFIDAPRTLAQVKLFKDLFLSWGCANVADINTIHIHAHPWTCHRRAKERAGRHARPDDQEDGIIFDRLRVYFGRGFEQWCETGQSPEDGKYGEGGILNEVIPWLETSTRYIRIDGDEDLEVIRQKVRDVHGPRLFGPVEPALASVVA